MNMIYIKNISIILVGCILFMNYGFAKFSKKGTTLNNIGNVIVPQEEDSKKEEAAKPQPPKQPCLLKIYSAHDSPAFINAHSANRSNPYHKEKSHTYTTTAEPNKTIELKLPCTGDYTLEAIPLEKGKAFGKKQCQQTVLSLSLEGSSASIVYPIWFQVNCEKPEK